MNSNGTTYQNGSFVNNASTFIIGDGSDLKVAKVENTASAIGTTENGKLSIDEYVGYNLENLDKLKTAGGSVGVSTSGITSIGVNYSDKKQEGITKNTVIGNVEIGKSSGDEINRDLDTMTEITEDRDFKTNINVESQTINYIKNPEKFKEDLQKAKNEVEDLGNAIKNTSNPLGKDKRNIFSNLRAQRWVTSFYNVIGSRVEELGRQFKAGEINEEDLKEAVRELAKGYGKDIGIDFDVVYLDKDTMPKDSEGSTGSAYIVDRKNRKVLIPIDVNKIEDIKELLGTLTEEVSHGKDALEGRQDKKVAEDNSNKEKGLETLGRPANEYVKKKFGEDNNSKIKLTTDGIDLSNADVGEKVGDVTTSEDRKIRTKHQAKYKYIQIDFDRAINGAVGLTGSVFRGGASYGLMSIGYSLAFAPEPFATKALGAGFMLGGLIAGAFTASDAVESGQDVYYGVTNQRDKKSVNFGRELLGEDTYDPLNMLSVAGMPILYDQANYTKVMVEGEAAKRAIIYNPNLTYDENKYLNDYMGKEMPGKVTSKYGDVKTYRYADVVDNNKNTSVSKTPVINKSGASQGINNTTKIASQNPNTSMANQNQISNVTVGTNKSLNIKQREGQNPQQWQRSRDSLAQNNKNSINKTQPQGNQDYSGNQQLSKGATSNNQQANKIGTSNSQQEAPATKISTNQGIKIGNLTVYKDYVIGERGATYKLRGLTINGDKYYENNESKYVIKNDKLVKIEATQVAEKFLTGDEKYYAKSEIDILNEVNKTISNTKDKYQSQKSYYNRKEVPCGTKDSVRPEGRSDGLNRTIEVKNYDVDKNSSSMISKIVEQAKERDIHLPKGNIQEVYIDIRNQNISLEKQEFIKNKIEKNSNGIIKKENIHFKK